MTTRRTTTVFFDVDGTLVESEQHGHRLAFNDAFARAGLDDRWDEATYADLLAVTGGARRLAAWFAQDPSSAVSTASVADLSRRLHREKTRIFIEMCHSGAVPERAGAQRLVAELAASGAQLAITTTGSRAWVEPLVTKLFGVDTFAFMITGDDVLNTKPSPEAYLMALDRIDHECADVVAIEDSMPGLKASVGANIPTVLVANAETAPGDWSNAALALTGFGDLPADTVVFDPSGLCPDGLLTASVVTTVARTGPASDRSSTTGDTPIIDMEHA